jgi:DNA-binding CsgD family transcriptional regulator
MNSKHGEIAAYWRSVYSEKIKESKSYDIPEQFNKIASLFAPGTSYYYIINFHNLELEYLSSSVKYFINGELNSITIKDLLEVALPEEVESLQLKEKVIEDFFVRFLNGKNITDYKVIYYYRMKDKNGKIRTMLHQATALSVDNDGFFLHVLSVHSDISHLNILPDNSVSFMNLKGGESYFNMDIHTGKFAPQKELKKPDLSVLLSVREKDIVSEIALGLSNDQIARKLNISPHTVKTHRKNIMKKSKCENSAQLVANCLMSGVINVEM